MKKISILALIICLSACIKDTAIVKTSGTKLISIHSAEDDRSWEENYTYSPDGKLSMIENNFGSGKRYRIVYENDKVKEYTNSSIDTDKLFFRDSIAYNPNGTISKIYYFSSNAGDSVPLFWIFEFEYDDENRVVKKLNFLVRTQEYRSTKAYHWKDGNIERVEYFNKDGKLQYEQFYTYDDKFNYQKIHPRSMPDPVKWGNNNVIKERWKYYDDEGIISSECNPCITQYIYNLDDYPAAIKLHFGREMTLKYE